VHLPAHKFIRAAFLWLLVGGALMAVEPWHLTAIGAPFSHAYTGAIRHALTVGFISQMILGVSLHIVPRLRGISTEEVPALWSAFLLLNLGNALRVGLEIVTDFSASGFKPMGLTGFIELIALAIWAGTILKMLFTPVNVSTIRHKGDVHTNAPLYN
jgi:hypothetical protein